MNAFHKRGRLSKETWDRADDVWTQIDWRPLCCDAVVNGRRVAYVDVGSGPTIILVHGQGGTWRFWLRVMPLLAQRCRVIAIDLPGFGDSDPVLDGDIMSEQVATLTGLMRQLGLVRVVVAGHSMGGLATLRMAAEDPATVAGVVLVDAGGSALGQNRLALILAAFSVFHDVFARRSLSDFVARRPLLFKSMFMLAVADTRSMSRALALEIFTRMAAPGFISTMKAAAEAVQVARPEQVAQPTLVLWGGRDRILPPGEGRALADKIPGSRLVVFDQVGHCPMIESPDQTAELMGDFVVEVLRHGSGAVPSPNNVRPASG
jgi:pimeloyl-ACP methyl ester carboxylesterase